MHNLRFLAATAFAVASLSSAPSQAQTCDPATFTNTCTGDSLTYCSTADETETTADCTTGFWSDSAAATCGSSGCIGDGCAVSASCIGDTNQRCMGFSGYLLTNPSPFAVLCTEGNSCVLGIDAAGPGVVDTCIANTGACNLAETHKGCDGEIATACLSFTSGDATLTDYVGTDCAAFGGTCALDADSAPYCELVEGAQCDPQLLLGCGTGLTCNPNTQVCEVAGPAPSQLGEACDANPCDTGLVCNANNICETAPACGDVTLQGECNGTVLSYCVGEQLVTRDCAAYYSDNPATCGLVNADWGFDCLVNDDAACAYSSNNQPVTAFCQEGSGCTLGDTGYTCTAGVGTCESPAAGVEFTPVCNGVDKVTVACNLNQPVAYSCPGSSTCSNGACNDLSAGEACLDDVMNCATGLVCSADGICTDPAAPIDAGTPVADAGTPVADAGTPVADAGTPVADAGTPVADAGTDPVTPTEDAGTDPVTPTEDAGTDPVTPTEDAGTDPVTPTEDAGTDPVTPTEDAGTDPIDQPILDPGTDEPSDDPAEEPPASSACSHVQTHAQRSSISGLFALLLMGTALRRRRK